MSGASTRAIETLQRAGVSFAVHAYELAGEHPSYGQAVAAALGVEPHKMFKTLIAQVDDRPIVAVVPVSGQLSLKALARAAGGKKATMAEAAEAERLTGYVVGGISPFGQKRRLPTYVDESALDRPVIFVSAGRRGLQLEIEPSVLLEVTGATSAPIAG